MLDGFDPILIHNFEEGNLGNQSYRTMTKTLFLYEEIAVTRVLITTKKKVRKYAHEYVVESSR